MSKLGVARPDDGVVVVAETGDGRLTQELLHSRHGPVHGGGRGPTPYELLLMSLGACTARTVRLYADRRGWPLGCMTVRLRHARAHEEDCAACDRTPAALDEIERLVDLPGPLDAAQRARLMRVADTCPVRRTLARGAKVRTMPARGGAD